MKSRAKELKNKAKAKISAIFAPEAALNTIKLSLGLLEKVVDGVPVPGLKAVVGSVLLVMQKIEKTTQNYEDFIELGQFIKRLSSALSPLAGKPASEVPWVLRERVKKFFDELKDVADDIDGLLSRGLPRRIIDETTDAQKVVGYIRDMNNKITLFLAESLIEVEMGVAKLLMKVNILILDKLNMADGAAWDSAARESAPMCLAGTRITVLSEVMEWVQAPGGGVYWVNGLAGIGKSTIAQTVAAMLAAYGNLGGSFFCSRDVARRSNVHHIFPTLSYQLARFDPAFRLNVVKALEANPDVANANLETQFRQLVIHPLNAKADANYSSVVVVIDALDECKDAYASRILLTLLSRDIHDLTLKIFITSRPESHIRSAFELKDWRLAPKKLVLHDISLDLVQHDIKRFVEAQLFHLATERYHDIPHHPWPSMMQIDKLVEQSLGLFIYASTACKFIADRHRRPSDQLDSLVETGQSLSLTGINMLYQHILDVALPLNHSSPEPDLDERLRKVMGAVVLIFDRLPIKYLASLLKIDCIDIRLAVQELHSVLIVPDNDGKPILTFHPSWHDFLTNPKACQNKRFYVDKEISHTNLSILCFEKIFEAQAGSTQHQNTKNSQIIISGDLKYACQFCFKHACQGLLSNDLIQMLKRFDSTHVAYWLSTLSQLGELASAIPAVKAVLEWLKDFDEEDKQNIELLLYHAQEKAIQMITKVISDASDDSHTLAFQQVIGSIAFLKEPFSSQQLDDLLGLHHGSVTRVLGSLQGLVIPPETETDTIQPLQSSLLDYLTNPELCSDSNIFINPVTQHMVLVKSCFARMMQCLKQDICSLENPSFQISATPGLQERVAATIPLDVQYSCKYWQSHLMHCPERNDSFVETLENFFSGPVVYWIEAMCLLKHLETVVQTLQLLEKIFNSHSMICEALHDVKGLLMKYGNTIMDFPLQLYYSAIPLSPQTTTFKKLNQYVLPVKVISGMENQWGPNLAILEGHADVHSVKFSPDGHYIVSGLGNVICIWDAALGTRLGTLKGQSTVNSVAFSPDGTRIASGSSDNTICIWDSITTACLSTLREHSDSVLSVAFSPDGNLVASGSSDNSICIWDGTTGTCLKTLKGHSQSAWSVAFSPDGNHIVSGSLDDTIRIWNIITGICVSTLTGHDDSVWCVAFSPNGVCIASGSGDKTVRIWSTQGSYMGILNGHSGRVNTIAYSPDGTHIVSGSSDRSICIWDATTEACLGTLKGHSGEIECLGYSPDGSYIVSGSSDKTTCIWVAKPDIWLQNVNGHSGAIINIVFSPDGTHIASGSNDSTICIWDAAQGSCLNTLKGHSGPVICVAFSPDSIHIVSGSGDKTICIWNVATSVCLSTIKGHSAAVNCVAFLPDGVHIVSGSDDRSICIWKFQECMAQFHTDVIPMIVSVSHDGISILSNAGSYEIPSTLVISEILPPDNKDKLPPYTINDSWLIDQNKRRLCWLPHQYRSTCMAYQDHKLVIGTVVGLLIILDVSSLHS